MATISGTWRPMGVLTGRRRAWLAAGLILAGAAVGWRPAAAGGAPPPDARDRKPSSRRASSPRPWPRPTRRPIPQQRDALLGQVAVAQAQAGARDAAVRSVALIGDDRARAHILAQVANPRAASRPTATALSAAAAQPDFDDLIDLITSTVAPKTWEDNGGPGTICRPFPPASGSMPRACCGRC